MTALHKSNLARTALAVLNGNTGLRFCMERFRSSFGNACCLVGHGPVALGVPYPDAGAGWTKFAEEKFGIQNSRDLWNFLFSGGWISDRDQCAARALLCLRDSVPEDWNFDSEFHVPTDLKDQLKAFVLP